MMVLLFSESCLCWNDNLRWSRYKDSVAALPTVCCAIGRGFLYPLFSHGVVCDTVSPTLSKSLLRSTHQILAVLLWDRVSNGQVRAAAQTCHAILNLSMVVLLWHILEGSS